MGVEVTFLVFLYDLFQLNCCGVNNVSDWGEKVPSSCCEDKCNTQSPKYWEKVNSLNQGPSCLKEGCLIVAFHWCLFQLLTLCLQGCLEKLKLLFEENFLTTGISVIVLCIVEVNWAANTYSPQHSNHCVRWGSCALFISEDASVEHCLCTPSRKRFVTCPSDSTLY